MNRRRKGILLFLGLSAIVYGAIGIVIAPLYFTGVVTDLWSAIPTMITMYAGLFVLSPFFLLAMDMIVNDR